MSTERIRDAVQGLAVAALPHVRHLGLYEYRVVTVDAGDYLSLQATDADAGVPDLARVAMRPGIGGSTTTPALGSLVLVAFINGDAARPVVVSFDDSTPTTAALDATSVRLGAAIGAVVRYGDTVMVGTAQGVATFVPAGLITDPSRVLA